MRNAFGNSPLAQEPNWCIYLEKGRDTPRALPRTVGLNNS